MIKNIVWGLAILLAAAGASIGGTKEEVRRLQQDVLALGNLIRSMQESQATSYGQMISLLEQLNDQAAQGNAASASLTQALRDRSGDTEKLAQEFREGFRKLTLQLDNTDSRIAALQKRLEEAEMKTERLRSYAPEPGTGAKPDQIYAVAYNDFLMANYDLAIAAFRDFLTTFPDSEYADNAAYYLGLSLMQQELWEAAINAFDELLNVYPKADMTTPAYYKKGMSQLAVRRNAEAIETFRKLVGLFPESQEANLARQELQKLGIDPAELEGNRRN